MGSNFEIGVGVRREMLATQPPQFAQLNVLYTAFSARVGQTWYPASVWCDFAGIWLFRWYEAVWQVSEGRTRAARLPFLHTYELWVRRTVKPWWKISMVERHAKGTTIKGDEILVIPEQVEAALLTAIQRLLRAAKDANAWKEDCAALESLVNDPQRYLAALDAGQAPLPHFLTPHFKVPAGF